MSWFAGFVLGVLGGWALGSLVAPRVGVRLDATPLGRWLPGAERDNGHLPGLGRGAPRGKATGLLQDERLTRRALERLAERGILHPRVDITTVDGVMYLRGRPRDAAEAAAVLEVAETTPGVERVVNEMKSIENV